MIAVIFELWPAEGQGDRYFDMAAGLREDLAGINGFISVERFESVSTPGASCRSNTAMLSTCAVWENVSIAPAATRSKPFATSSAASRASVPGWQET